MYGPLPQAYDYRLVLLCFDDNTYHSGGNALHKENNVFLIRVVKQVEPGDRTAPRLFPMRIRIAKQGDGRVRYVCGERPGTRLPALVCTVTVPACHKPLLGCLAKARGKG